MILTPRNIPCSPPLISRCIFPRPQPQFPMSPESPTTPSPPCFAHQDGKRALLGSPAERWGLIFNTADWSASAPPWDAEQIFTLCTENLGKTLSSEIFPPLLSLAGVSHQTQKWLWGRKYFRQARSQNLPFTVTKKWNGRSVSFLPPISFRRALQPAESTPSPTVTLGKLTATLKPFCAHFWTSLSEKS